MGMPAFEKNKKLAKHAQAGTQASKVSKKAPKKGNQQKSSGKKAAQVTTE